MRREKAVFTLLTVVKNYLIQLQNMKVDQGGPHFIDRYQKLLKLKPILY